MGSVLFWSRLFLLHPVTVFGTGKLTLGHALSRIRDLLLTSAQSQEFTLSLRGDRGLGTFGQSCKCQHYGTLGDGLNAFCIVGWT